MFLAGGQIGQNWQREHCVFWLALDTGGAASDGTHLSCRFRHCRERKTQSSSRRLRHRTLRWPARPHAGLFQGTVGLGRGDVVNSSEFLPYATRGHSFRLWSCRCHTRRIEQVLTPAWSVKFEPPSEVRGKSTAWNDEARSCRPIQVRPKMLARRSKLRTAETIQ